MFSEVLSKLFSNWTGCGLCFWQSVQFCGPCVLNRRGPEGRHLWSLFLMPQYKGGQWEPYCPHWPLGLCLGLPNKRPYNSCTWQTFTTDSAHSPPAANCSFGCCFITSFCKLIHLPLYSKVRYLIYNILSERTLTLSKFLVWKTLLHPVYFDIHPPKKLE